MPIENLSKAASIQYHQLSPAYFDEVIVLANRIYGDNYLDSPQLQSIYQRSFANNINASWVACDKNNKLIGFRLTLAAGHWSIDKWCSVDSWSVDVDKVVFFKCNTVDENYRGYGIGSRLLALSVEQAKAQGSEAGLAFIWLNSPGNVAFRYFSRCGGKIIQRHAQKWRQMAIEEDYQCCVCDGLCACDAAEMLLTFTESKCC